MSEITTWDLYYDRPDGYGFGPNGDKDLQKWREAVTTPIVPRKMVEMIIRYCDDVKSDPLYKSTRNIEDFIKEYAESLLNDFERGNDYDE